MVVKVKGRRPTYEITRVQRTPKYLLSTDGEGSIVNVNSSKGCILCGEGLLLLLLSLKLLRFCRGTLLKRVGEV